MNEIRVATEFGLQPSRIGDRRPNGGRRSAPDSKTAREKAQELEPASDEPDAAHESNLESQTPGAIDVLA
jgi:hypothetical protein